MVAINLIADPNWDEAQFRYALEVSSGIQLGATVCRPLSGGAIYLSPPQGHVVTTLKASDRYVHVPKITQQRARRTTRDTPARDVSAPEARVPVAWMHWDKS